MNAKHYVSLEVAKMLKEKGYNGYSSYCYHCSKVNQDGAFVYCGGFNNEDFVEWESEVYIAPTLLEAMDWLEEKGIRISIKYDWIECGWYYIVIDGTPTIKNITEVEKSDGIFYKDRNECMNEAIKKGLELCGMI